MGKSKKSQSQQYLSPEQFIKQRVRKLEIGKCYISNELLTAGEGNIVISRNHTGGKKSIAFFLVDMYCLGIKDSFYALRIDKEEYEEQFVNGYLSGYKEISYNEAHNYIYGAIAFAEEAGIAPNRSFYLTKYFLEEDTDEIPLIEYEYGKNGQHFLVAHSNYEASIYLSTLKHYLGDNFDYVIVHDDETAPAEGEEEYEDEDEKDFNNVLEDITPEKIEEMLEKYENLDTPKQLTPYTYEHPKYPQRLVLKNKELKEMLFSDKNPFYLSKKEIKTILSLPHDTLKADLEKIVLYSINQAHDKDYEALEQKGIIYAFVHALILLGEIGDDKSLDVVFEALRQPQEVINKLCWDYKDDLFIPTLYKLGNQRLTQMQNFAKEEGLYTYSHCMVYPSMALMAAKQPERREEWIAWFKDILQTAISQLPDIRVFDSTMMALIICDLVDIHAKELLPEIKRIYEIGILDTGICGKLENVDKDINNPNYPSAIYLLDMDINKRYEWIRISIG